MDPKTHSENILKQYYDAAGRPVNCTDGYCKVARAYGEDGKLLFILFPFYRFSSSGIFQFAWRSQTCFPNRIIYVRIPAARPVIPKSCPPALRGKYVAAVCSSADGVDLSGGIRR